MKKYQPTLVFFLSLCTVILISYKTFAYDSYYTVQKTIAPTYVFQGLIVQYNYHAPAKDGECELTGGFYDWYIYSEILLSTNNLYYVQVGYNPVSEFSCDNKTICSLYYDVSSLSLTVDWSYFIAASNFFNLKSYQGIGNAIATFEYGCWSKKKEPPKPPKKCNQKEYCKDEDGDGHGFPGLKMDFCSDEEASSNGYVIDNPEHCNDSCDHDEYKLQPDITWYIDEDDDGHGDPKQKVLLCDTQGDLEILKSNFGHSASPVNDDDCDNNPNMIEPATYFLDQDSDGKGTKFISISSCEDKPTNDLPQCNTFYGINVCAQWVKNNSDECDSNPFTFKEIPYFRDIDQDGFGEAGALPFDTCYTGIEAITKGFSKISLGEDECDKDASIQKKNVFYLDKDGDKFGDPKQIGLSCEKSMIGYVKNKIDCDDNDPNKNPGKLVTYYQDLDGDGWGNPKIDVAMDVCSNPSKLFVLNSDDCNDFLNGYPKKSAYYDSDGDGYGLFPFGVTCDYLWNKKLVFNNSDCNDDDSTINPVAKKTYYSDGDGDGYGSIDYPQLIDSCKNIDSSSKLVTNSYDCDDGKTAVGFTTTYYADFDKDGFGDASNKTIINCKDNNWRSNITNKVSNSNDLNDLIKARSIVENIATAPDKGFLKIKENNETDYCIFNGSKIECLGMDFWQTHCRDTIDKKDWPQIGLNNLAEIPISSLPSLDLTLACLKIHRENQIKLLDVNGIHYAVTYFESLGYHIFPAIGTEDFKVELPKVVDKIILSETHYANYIEPFIVTNLKQIQGIFPIKTRNSDRLLANNKSVVMRRRTIYNNGVGPEISIVTDKQQLQNYKDNGTIVNLLYTPILQITDIGLGKLTSFDDADLDWIPTEVEKEMGLNPKKKDSDGDKVNDGVEYYWGGNLPDLAINENSKPKNLTGGNSYKIFQDTLGAEESFIFNQAKKIAHELVELMTTKADALFGSDSNLELFLDSNTIHSLIDDAKSALLWEVNVTNLKSSDLLLPYVNAGRSMLGAKQGCGEDSKNICVDVKNHFVYYKNNETRILMALVDTLLHEALHNIITINVDDPDYELEHEIIAAILGQSSMLEVAK